MGEMRENITGRKLCEITGRNPDALRMVFAKRKREGHPLFAFAKWGLDQEFSPEIVSSLYPAKSEAKAKEIKAVPVAHSGTIGGEKALPKEVAPTLPSPAPMWPVWVILTITAGASVPKMYQITSDVMGSSLVAIAWTALFTAVPFLFVQARVSGRLAWWIVGLVMTYTAFCNAVAIFGGLTALDSGFVLKPTVFLETVTNMLNTPYGPTARIIAAVMAVLGVLIELLAFKRLNK